MQYRVSVDNSNNANLVAVAKIPSLQMTVLSPFYPEKHVHNIQVNELVLVFVCLSTVCSCACVCVHLCEYKGLYLYVCVFI